MAYARRVNGILQQGEVFITYQRCLSSWNNVMIISVAKLRVRLKSLDLVNINCGTVVWPWLFGGQSQNTCLGRNVSSIWKEREGEGIYWHVLSLKVYASEWQLIGMLPLGASQKKFHFYNKGRYNWKIALSYSQYSLSIWYPLACEVF